MATVDKRSISLTTELAAIVDGAVAEGSYASGSEVVRDALREWNERRECYGYTRDELRALIKEGLENGEPKPWNKAEFLEEARERLQMKRDS